MSYSKLFSTVRKAGDSNNTIVAILLERQLLTRTEFEDCHDTMMRDSVVIAHRLKTSMRCFVRRIFRIVFDGDRQHIPRSQLELAMHCINLLTIQLHKKLEKKMAELN